MKCCCNLRNKDADSCNDYTSRKARGLGGCATIAKEDRRAKCPNCIDDAKGKDCLYGFHVK